MAGLAENVADPLALKLPIVDPVRFSLGVTLEKVNDAVLAGDRLVITEEVNIIFAVGSLAVNEAPVPPTNPLNWESNDVFVKVPG